MKLWSRVKKDPSPTVTDVVENEKPIALERSLEEQSNAQGDGLQHHIHPDIERRVVRKMDMRIVPLVTALYVLAFLDRSNIGNAKIAGMEKELHLVGNKYQWLLTIFYISYILFEFQSLMWKIVPPHLWLTFCVFCWGVFATCQSATRNWSGMMALRFLLGISEAGFGPGIPYLLSFFYLRHEVGVRIAVFLSAAPLSTTFSGALAYGYAALSSTLLQHSSLYRLLSAAKIPSLQSRIKNFSQRIIPLCESYGRKRRNLLRFKFRVGSRCNTACDLPTQGRKVIAMIAAELKFVDVFCCKYSGQLLTRYRNH